MALAETELQPEAKRPLERDQFVKRRQDARAAADPSPEEGAGSGTAGPGDGDGISPPNGRPDRPEDVQGDELNEPPEGGPESDLSLFDDDETSSGDEPSRLTGLEPPASMTDSEKAAFEGLPDEIKSYVARVHSSTARTVQESGESLAARNKEIEDRVAELDRSLVQARAVLDSQSENLPYPQEVLAKIAEDHGFEAWRKAMAQNQAAMAQGRNKLDSIDEQIKGRQQQILIKLNEELPKLIPSWAKPEVRKKEAGELGAYLTSSGFNEAELKMVTDARLVMLARKAMRYDAALAKKRERSTKGNGRAQPGPTGARRTGTAGGTKLETAEKRYRDNPSADNFARLRAVRREAAEASHSRRRV